MKKAYITWLILIFILGGASQGASNQLLLRPVFLQNFKPTLLDRLLFQAISRADLETVKTLLAKGADANAEDENGWTPLIRASRGEKKEHLEIVKVLLSAGASLKPRQDGDGYTPLHAAAFSRRSDIVKELLLHKADVNTPTKRGWTPLFEAVFSHDKDFIQLFLNAGADIALKDEDGQTAFHLASSISTPEVVQLFLSAGAKLEARDKAGNTPLLLGVQNGTNAYLTLLEAGADVQARNHLQETPLILAALRLEFQKVKKLIQMGAEVNAQDINGGTALIYTARESKFLKQDCGMNNYLSNFNHLGLQAQYLIRANAKIDIQNNKGETALMLAAKAGHAELVQLLLAAGANPYLKDKKKHTAILYANQAPKEHRSKVVSLLKNPRTKSD